MYGRKYSKKAKVAAPARRRRYAARRRKTVAPMETATIKQTIIQTDLQAHQGYESVVSLPLFSRALDIADNYQEYRIVSVEYKYTPCFDTFIINSGGTEGNSIPYLYSKVLTVPSPATFGIDFLKTMGAKPRRLDDKTLTVKYKPVINQQGMSDGLAGGNAIRKIRSPWLSTHFADGTTGNTTMDSTEHGYHSFWIDTSYNAGGGAHPVICTYECTATFEFRKPWDLKASTPPPGTAAKINTNNVNN